jgi:hypothetical protein
VVVQVAQVVRVVVLQRLPLHFLVIYRLLMA